MPDRPASRDADAARRRAQERPGLLERLRGELAEVLVEAAADGRATAAKLLLDLGVPIDARGQMHGTALHHAAWWGRADVVALLLRRGADPYLRQSDAATTPLHSAADGSANARPQYAGPHMDHVAVAELLVADGLQPDAAAVELAAGELEAWLRARLDETPPDAAERRRVQRAAPRHRRGGRRLAGRRVGAVACRPRPGAGGPTRAPACRLRPSDGRSTWAPRWRTSRRRHGRAPS